VSGESIAFKSGNLSTLELLQLYNKHITPLAPVEETSVKVVKTKSEKKAGIKTKKQ
jgi:large subunit ribosomal protein L53